MNPTSKTPVGTEIRNNKPGTYIGGTVIGHADAGALKVRLSGGIIGSIKPENFSQWDVTA